jgi:methylated-DNA-[protein]-cysteine S-methyltransferase
VRRACAAITALLRGDAKDLSHLVLDFTGVPPFHQRVYVAARKIPCGETRSYGDLAAELGSPGAARAVGQAMRKNPFAIIVPCHRVLAAGGKLGGFTANGGALTKRRMLEIEGAAPEPRGRAPSAETPDAKSVVRYLRARDPALARVIERVGPFRIELQTTDSLFAALAEAIVYQQLTGKAAATIFGRVRALCPRSKLAPGALLALPDSALRGAGLSQAKMLSLQDLARRVQAKSLPTLRQVEALDDEAVIERLTEVRGIGRWTVQMLLIFRLGRRDVLPLDDYGVRKGFAAAFGKRDLPTKLELERYGERWKPHRSAASWYLWRAAEAAPRRKSNPK